MRDDGTKLMALEVSLDAFAKKLGPKLAPQHVQHPAALRINQVSEQIGRIIVAPKNDGTRIFRHGAIDEPARAVEHAVEKILLAVLMAVVKVRVIRREAFVQPDLAPVFARHQISEP